MPVKETAAGRGPGDCVNALRRMPLATRARIEAESNALLKLLAGARQLGCGDDESNAILRMIEERVARIQSQLVIARM